MKTKTSSLRCFATSVAMAALVSGTASAAFTVQSGRTDVFLDGDILQSIGWSIPVVGSENLSPMPGFSTAFPILSTSTFSYDLAGGFNFIGGAITHSGSVSLANQPDLVEVGSFSIGFDSGFGGFLVTDTLTTGGALFSLDLTDATISATATELSIDGAVLRATGLLSSVLVDNDSLVGAAVGNATVTAQAIPEPSVALSGLAGLLLLLKRRR